MEQFTILDTIADFAAWANSYGTRKQKHYQWSHPGNELLRHTTGPWEENTSWGEILFHFARDPDGEHLHITTELWNGLHPPSEELLAYLQEMTVAIRKRWRQVPQKPNKGARIREWSIYRYQMKEAGMRPPTHQEVADENNYQPPSLRNDYSRFLRENGLVDEEENM